MKVIESSISLVSQEEKELYYYGADKPPKGFRTAMEWRKIWGKGKSQTTYKLNELVERGIMERKDFKIQRTSCLQVLPHYAIKK